MILGDVHQGVTSVLEETRLRAKNKNKNFDSIPTGDNRWLVNKGKLRAPAHMRTAKNGFLKNLIFDQRKSTVLQ